MADVQENFSLNEPIDPDTQDFSGNIYIFHAFDVGDDINLKKIGKSRAIKTKSLSLPKYFKHYQMPIAVELPHPHNSSYYMSCKIHNFGAISLTYKIPFNEPLEQLHKKFNKLNYDFQEQSVIDVKSIFKRIEDCISQPRFFETRSSYSIIQVNPSTNIDIPTLQKKYGNIITSAIRFELESLSEYQKNEILDSAIGYFRGDLIIVDTDVAFVYDAEYEDILDFFEFANIQQLELRYFDRLLDQQLNKIYEGEGRTLPLRAYLPFIGTLTSDAIGGLGKLKVDISVIAERLEGSIKLAGEPYLSELYELLVEKLDLNNWQGGIDRKLTIIKDVQTVYQNKIDIIREDLLSVLVIVLIFIELVIGILNYIKG